MFVSPLLLALSRCVAYAQQERDGWYPEEQYDQIRGVLRLKYFHLLEGRTISDEECREMMLESVEADRTLVSLAREKGTGKRSKPKARGQANPEDAAVSFFLAMAWTFGKRKADLCRQYVYVRL